MLILLMLLLSILIPLLLILQILSIDTGTIDADNDTDFLNTF